MSIQSIESSNGQSTLNLTWKVYEEGLKAISIQISKDSEFTNNSRHFVIPPTASSISLDLGQGLFFYRLGAWTPSGQIDWSPIYGPASVICSKSLPSITQSTLKVHYTQSITNGIRMYTNKIQKSVYYIEYTTDTSFKASNTYSCYNLDSLSSGHADCMNLHPSMSYTIRVYHLDTLPTNSVVQLSSPIILQNQKAYPLSKRSNTQESAGIKAAELTLLKEASERPTRFTSHSDYLMYLNAKAKNSNTLHKI